MEMEKILSYIGVNRGKGRKVSLDRMKWLMKQLGNPEQKMKFIHIAGTNGKGSVAAFLLSVLEESGFHVGLFTSPHLEQINERIRVGSALISDQDLKKYTEKVAIFVDEFEQQHPDERFFAFEILTAVALLYFADQKLDIVILEAGIGGRLDATNVIPTPEVCMITLVGKDHTKVLGETLEEIAHEKACILKAGGQMIVGPVSDRVGQVIDKRAQTVDGHVVFVDRSSIEVIQIHPDFQCFLYEGSGPWTIQLQGPHQLSNACVALKAVEALVERGWTVETEAIARGLAKAFWPGRFEKVSDRPLVFLDGAHNLPAVKELMATIHQHFPGQKITFVIGMMQDKDYRAMIEYSLPYAKKYLVISPDAHRGFDAQDVAQWLQREKAVPAQSLSSPEAIKQYVEEAEPEEVIIQFGSLYLVGALREKFCL